MAGAVEETLAKCTATAKGGACSVYALNNIVVAGGDWRSVPERDPRAPEIPGLRPERWVAARGPQAARGLIVWSHGYLHGADATESLPQPHVSRFLAVGYDVYRFDREWTSSMEYPGQVLALARAAAKARELGYRRVVLSGQSHGGWTSLDAAAHRAPVDAVIAIAPARHGLVQRMANPQQARWDWEKLVDDVPPAVRVAIALFEDDGYDLGGRGEVAARAFAANAVPHVLIDRPDGFRGHGAATVTPFADRFGRCLIAFAETGEKQAPCQ